MRLMLIIISVQNDLLYAKVTAELHSKNSKYLK